MNFVEDLDVKGKRVFLRVDFNVPLDDSGEIRDDTRIKASLPTIRLLLEQGARLVLASHLGRPKGKPDPKMSLKPGRETAGRAHPRQGHHGPRRRRRRGRPARRRASARARFSSSRTSASTRKRRRTTPASPPSWPRAIDIFVNDAFGSSHRAHASVVGIADHVPVKAAGFLMKKEVDYLKKAIHTPVKPYVAILGGAKVEDKIPVIESLLDKADHILIGGAMAYTFLKAQGLGVGKSLVEDDRAEIALVILDKARKNEVSFHLPLDHVLAPAVEAGAETRIVETLPFPDDLMGVDIGPKTVAAYAEIIAEAKTIFWNGPLGVFEIDAFAEGTIGIAEAVAASGRRLHRRRRRLDRRRQEGRGQGQDQPHLDGRRGLPRIPRLRDPARDRRPGKIDGPESAAAPFVAGNWKMHLTLAEARALARRIAGAAPGAPAGAPSSSSRPSRPWPKSAGRSPGRPSAWAPRTSTGRTRAPSPARSRAPMLKDAGCRYVLVGHSERRQFFGETDETVSRKVRAALRSGLSPIVCVGETLEEREAGRTMDRIDRQLDGGLAGLAEGGHRAGRPRLRARLGHRDGADGHPGPGRGGPRPSSGGTLEEAMEKTPAACAIILYGGSVKPANAYSLFKEKNIDGFLVGGASLDAASFVGIVREALRAYKEEK